MLDDMKQAVFALNRAIDKLQKADKPENKGYQEMYARDIETLTKARDIIWEHGKHIAPAFFRD